MRKLTKILSAILVIVLCVQIIAPGTVAVGATSYVGHNAAKSAADGITLPSQSNALERVDADSVVQNIESLNDSSDDRIVTPIVGEIKELRTENTKHYRHKDGTYTAAVYSEPIHYMDSTGSWQDIDNTLILNSKRKSVSGKATYTPAASSLDIRIPQDFTDNQMLTIGKDGYTVGMRLKTSDNTATMSRASATASGKINSAKAVINNNFENIDVSSISSIADDSVSNNFEVETANKEAMKLDKKVSAVNYNDVLDGTDLQYVITPSKVKENIIVTEIQDSYVYQFELDLDGLIPVAQENGSIKLYENKDDDEALFTIEKPYMYDANEETSFDVAMSLNGNILTVTANAEWINDESRKLPVIIDPTFSDNASNFYDATANKNTPIMNFDTYKFLYAGNGTLNLRRTYIKFTLPRLPEGSVVTDAQLSLMQHDVNVGNSNMKLFAFDLTGLDSWSESSITWNKQPVSKDKNAAHENNDIKNLDYVPFAVSNADGKEYKFNITKAVKNWYEGSTNNGLMITSSDENENSQAVLYSSNHSESGLHPSVKVNYNNNIGLEDYWSYETVDLGRSGMIYANPYNGSVTYVHSDLNMTGNLLPISVSHIYNSNTDDIYAEIYSGMNTGEKYHLNVQEILVFDDKIDKYKHYDSDGTLHYFYSADDGEITHEYDPNQTLEEINSEFILSDAQGNKKFFNAKGQLYKIVDKNNNHQTIHFTDNKITQIVDTVGRIVTLRYNQYDQLEYIIDAAGRSIKYVYDSTEPTAYISEILYPDGEKITYTYSFGNLFTINSYDGSYCALTFSYSYYRGDRVSTINHYDKTPELIKLSTFRYIVSNTSGIASGNTVVSNFHDKYRNNLDCSRIYLFDFYGRTTSVTTEDDQTYYAAYGSDANKATFNKITDSSELLTISTNELKNHGFENGTNYWSALQTANGSWGLNDVPDECSLGSGCMELELTSNSGTFEVGQDFSASAGQTYTVSVDINIPSVIDLNGNNGVAFGLVYCIDGVWHNDSVGWMGSTVGWERFSHTVTLPDGNLTNCHVFLELSEAIGKVYFDNVQVEKSGGARSYNLIENSDFSKGTGSNYSPWTPSDMQSGDGVQFIQEHGRNFFMMAGSVNHNKELMQVVPINAKAGDSLIVGGKAAAYPTSGTSNNRAFDIKVSLRDTSGTEIDCIIVPFDRNIGQERQVKAAHILLEEDCDSLVFSFRYHKDTGPCTLDSAFVYVGNYGEHYEYTDNGLIDYTYNNEGSTTKYSYDNNDVTQITQFTSVDRMDELETNSIIDSDVEPEIREVVVNYEYDSNHNVTSATNNIGTRIEYEYNSAGQVTKQTTISKDENNEDITMTEIFTYYQSGNYLKGHTDAADVTTLYVYDNDDNGENITKGLVTSITEPNGNIITYTYDPNTDELLSTSGEADTSVLSTTSFTYENHLPKTITKNGTSYSYEYDAQNRVVSSKVGTQTLTTNSYDDKQRLSNVTYGNNDEYAPIYDSRNRLVGDSWNETQISQYYYNENDRLSKIVDNVTDTSYQYDYAFYDLPLRVTGSDGTLTTYDYDKSGSLARLTFSDDNDTIYSGKYYTNDKGMPEDVVIDTLDNTTIHYNYDDFGRVESYSYGPVIRTITYESGSIYNGPKTTNNRIVEITDETKDGNHLQVYYFEYNDDGSFYYSYEGVDGQSFDYIYDGLGRVIENYTSEDLYVYSYDAAGNITSVGIWYEPIRTFTYDNENWKDQLTAVDGKAITYDANGNPLTFDGYNYTWQRGTQLAGITGNGKTINYVYDSQGHRVQKTVNGVTTNYLYSGDLLMRQTDGTNTLDFQYDANGNMVGFVYNGVAYYYLRNLLNDVSGIVDGEGNVVAKYRYDAYGNIIYSTGTMAEINPIRYRGYYYDTETNWYYLQSRYYNPKWCRFISPDSLFVAGDAIKANNMYSYCNNNPVLYVDELGTAAEESDFVKITRPIVNAVTIVGWLIPEAIGNYVIKKHLGEKNDPNDFSYSSESWFLFTTALPFFTNDILYGFDCILYPILNHFDETKDWKKRVYSADKGLQYILWPYTMAMGSRLGAFFLEFFPDDSFIPNYTTREGQYQWQHKMGYNWMYDFFFSLGGPIKKLVYEFAHTNPDEETKYYAVWCWKGDYWNLGPGAEIGIYYQKDKKKAERGFYDIDKDNLKIKTYMKVDYDGKIGLIPQTNWWITIFMPWKGQRIELDKLQVWQAVSFDIPVGKTDKEGTPYIADYSKHDNLNLFNSFRTSKWDNEIAAGNEKNLYWGPTPPTNAGWDYLDPDGNYYGNFQFYIKF